MRSRVSTIALVAAAVAIAPSAWAQSSLSADQIINALKPTPRSLQSDRTRGIHPLPSGYGAEPMPAMAATPAPAPAGTRPRHPAASTQTADAAAQAPSVNLYVEFATGSATLTPAAISTLDELGKALASNTLSSYRFRIEGHTDTVGTQPYNQVLSEQRAAAVADYIEHRFGVNADRLTAVGLGASHLLVPTPDQTPEARNRRVQVINLGA